MASVKPSFSISTKLILVMVFSGLLILIGVAISSIYIFKSSLGDLYKKMALVTESSFETALSMSDLDNIDKLQLVIEKIIYLNPEVTKLNLNIFDESKNQLQIKASNYSDSIGMSSDDVNTTSFKNESIYKEDVIINANESGVRVVSPVSLSGRKVGTSDIYVSTQRELTAYYNRMFVLLGIVMMLILFSTAVLYFATKRIILNPIQKLHGSMEKMQTGDFEVKEEVYSNDEMGEISKAFAQMAQDLKVSYASLEGKVVEKTKELEDKLREMEKMNQLMIGRELKMMELKKALTEKEAGGAGVYKDNS